MFGVLLRPTSRAAIWQSTTCWAASEELSISTKTSSIIPSNFTSPLSFSTLSSSSSSSSSSFSSFSTSSSMISRNLNWRSRNHHLLSQGWNMPFFDRNSIRFQSSLHLRMEEGEESQPQAQQNESQNQKTTTQQRIETEKGLTAEPNGRHFSTSSAASDVGASSGTALVVAGESRKPSMIIFRALAEKGPMTRLDLYNAVVSDTFTKTKVKRVLRLLISQRHIRVRRNPAPPKKGRKAAPFLFEVFDFRKEPFCSHPLLIRLRQENWRYQNVAQIFDAAIKRPKI